MSTLAIDGGAPVRTRPFPKRNPFGPADLQQVTEALNQQTLFFPSGQKVYGFERAFEELYGVRHAVTSTSGTSAIHVALGAIDPEPGDEIITTPISDMGTVAPIVLQNCLPIFADVDPLTFNLNPDDVEAKITERTRAIIVVHCWGQPARMERFLEIARRHNLYLIEDCAQAHLTHYQGKLVGTLGDLGAFSLQDSKHLQCGDGGVTITDHEELGERAMLFVDKGCNWSEDRKVRLKYAFIAPCYRMTELQGAILLAQLPRLSEIVQRRQLLGDLLVSLLQDVPGITPPARTPDAEHSYWSFPVLVDGDVLGVTPEQFAAAVTAEGVPMGGNWLGKPLYLFDSLLQQITYGRSHFPFGSAFAGRKVEYGPGLCPQAEWAMARLRTIPIHERYTEIEVHDIATAVRKVAEAYVLQQRRVAAD
jgi:dTDP-4-amino-4,6-dideoxygalactose transaminase